MVVAAYLDKTQFKRYKRHYLERKANIKMLGKSRKPSKVKTRSHSIFKIWQFIFWYFQMWLFAKNMLLISLTNPQL